MTKYKDWTDDEFKAYLFLYAADSNFEYHEKEKSFIESKFDSDILKDGKRNIFVMNVFDQIDAAAAGNISGIIVSAGGLCGYSAGSRGTCILTNCYNQGNISGASAGGGKLSLEPSASARFF